MCIEIHSTQTFRCFVLVDILNFSHSRLPRSEALLNALIQCLGRDTSLLCHIVLDNYPDADWLIANFTSSQGLTLFRVQSRDYHFILTDSQLCLQNYTFFLICKSRVMFFCILTQISR